MKKMVVYFLSLTFIGLNICGAFEDESDNESLSWYQNAQKRNAAVFAKMQELNNSIKTNMRDAQNENSNTEIILSHIDEMLKQAEAQKIEKLKKQNIQLKNALTSRIAADIFKHQKEQIFKAASPEIREEWLKEAINTLVE